MEPAEDDPTTPIVVIRSSKKGKAYRRRAEPTDPEPEDALQAAAPSATPAARDPRSTVDSGDQDAEEDGLTVAEILRRRQARKPKLGGVGFGAGHDGQRADLEAGALVRRQDGAVADPAQQQADLLAGMTKRFAPQTGLVGELVNKHMEEYIEAELARRHQHATDSQDGGDGTRSAGEAASSQELANATVFTADGRRLDGPSGPGALRGKLQEVDLGDETRLRNEALTERARRRLHGESVEEAGDGDGGGKKQLQQRRKRRASEDVKRDELVEAVLRESRIDVDVYDAHAAAAAAAADAEDGDEDDDENLAADDRIAAEFRREFYEAMAQRNRRRRQAQPSRGPQLGKQRDEILRGPKLGGSRNTRAAMREILLKEQGEKKKLR